MDVVPLSYALDRINGSDFKDDGDYMSEIFRLVCHIYGIYLDDRILFMV
jgi:hypothetical protein